MIFHALTILRSQLQVYIEQIGGANDEVVLGNVALAGDQGNTALNDKLILSMVGIEEETTMRNSPSLRPSTDGYAMAQPPLHVNVHLLLSAHYSTGTGTTPYENALTRLSQAITFFQSKPLFNAYNSPGANFSGLEKLTIELQTLGLEQTNQLWGALGGRMVPAALYKVRMLIIDAGRISGTGPAIEIIQANETKI
ncbi:MAG: DUF4255 domain-containing protein [Bacteroidia bacterium]